MKVIKGFFCIKEKKTYSKGDEYTGGRKDIGHLLESPKKETKVLKKKPKVSKKA